MKTIRHLLFVLLILWSFSLPGCPVFNLDQTFRRNVLTELRTPHSLDTVFYTATFTNSSELPLELVLELRNPFLRQIQVQWVIGSGKPLVFNTGADFPFQERPLPNRFFTFPLTLQPSDSATLILSLQNRGYRDRVVVELHHKQSFASLSNRRITVLTTYLSAGIFTLVFGFIILAVIRAYIRFSFIYYFGIGLLLVATLQGLAFQYAWPNHPGWQSFAKPILLNATFLGGFRFLQRFFRTGLSLPFFDRILYLLMIGLGSFAALALATPLMSPTGLRIYQSANDAWFLACIVMVAVIPPVYYARTKLPEALWFLVAYAVLMASVLTGIGSGLGLYRTGPALDTWILAGVLILHIVISAVILERVRLVVEEQARARRDLALEKIRQLRDLVIQEEMERERIGADLHDEAGSRFAAMKMALSGLAYREQNSARTAALQELIAEVDRICEVNRTISHRLLSVSLNQAGLPEALREYQVRLRAKGRHVVFRVAPGTLDGLSDTAEILIYRAILEVVEGLYENVASFRVLLEDTPDRQELVLTAESIDEALPPVDPADVTLSSLRTRLSLFSTTREESLQFLSSGVRIWLLKKVESAGV